MKKGFPILITFVVVFTLVTAALAETVTLPSGEGTSVVYGPIDHYAVLDSGDWGAGSAAVLSYKHSSWPLIEGSTARYISSAEYVEAPYAANSWRKFNTELPLCAGAYDVSVAVTANADNAEEVYVNKVFVGGDGEVQGTFTDDHEWATMKQYNSVLGIADKVVVDFIVRNYSGPNTPTTNPTGLIYNIDVTYACPVEVDIDIKPGSDPSCFNNDGSGVIPVAINGSATFDVMNVDAGSVTLEGLSVALKGKSDKLMAAYEDWNFDGYLDLVLKIEDVDNTFQQGSGTAKLMGTLYDGTPFFGIGDICITQ